MNGVKLTSTTIENNYITDERGKIPDGSRHEYARLNRSFTYTPADTSDLLQHIICGHGYAPNHGAYKTKKNFKSSSFTVLDCDGFTDDQMESILSDKWIVDNAWIAHFTPSHGHKTDNYFRIVFLHKNLKKIAYTALVKRIHAMYPITDSCVKNISQFYYGGELCKWFGNRLNIDSVSPLVDRIIPSPPYTHTDRLTDTTVDATGTQSSFPTNGRIMNYFDESLSASIKTIKNSVVGKRNSILVYEAVKLYSMVQGFARLICNREMVTDGLMRASADIGYSAERLEDIARILESAWDKVDAPMAMPEALLRPLAMNIAHTCTQSDRQIKRGNGERNYSPDCEACRNRYVWRNMSQYQMESSTHDIRLIVGDSADIKNMVKRYRQRLTRGKIGVYRYCSYPLLDGTSILLHTGEDGAIVADTVVREHLQMVAIGKHDKRHISHTVFTDDTMAWGGIFNGQRGNGVNRLLVWNHKRSDDDYMAQFWADAEDYSPIDEQSEAVKTVHTGYSVQFGDVCECAGHSFCDICMCSANQSNGWLYDRV